MYIPFMFVYNNFISPAKQLANIEEALKVNSIIVYKSVIRSAFLPHGSDCWIAWNKANMWGMSTVLPPYFEHFASKWRIAPSRQHRLRVEINFTQFDDAKIPFYSWMKYSWPFRRQTGRLISMHPHIHTHIYAYMWSQRRIFGKRFELKLHFALICA